MRSGAEDLAAVAAEFPDAQVALIGVGPTWDMRSGDSLAVRSQCDPLADLGVAGDALAVMAPASRASLASALSAVTHVGLPNRRGALSGR